MAGEEACVETMDCRFHPDRDARVVCQKMQYGYCEECIENCGACTDPKAYCKSRPQCIVWELCKKTVKKSRQKAVIRPE
jgi:hypothetical protein